MSFTRSLLALPVLLFFGCGSSSQPAASDTGSDGTDTLSALGLFLDPVAQTPADGVIPYDVISVLYADEAEKQRFVAIPPGSAATYDPMEFWDFPDGTKLIKTFYYSVDQRDPTLGRRLLETRIVEREAGIYTGRTYVWNDEQTEAVRVKVGQTISVQWIDPSGANQTLDYLVPDENQCKKCHSKDHVFQPLGPRTRQLNRDHDYGTSAAPDVENQIDHLVSLGLVGGDVGNAADRYTLADPNDDNKPIEQRTRSYLDANCSHCHRPGGEAGSTALDLRAETVDPFSLGSCRTPVAAGPGSGDLPYDIVPGDPDQSIIVYRMASTIAEIKMPQLPTKTSDAAGVALVSAWIQAMAPMPCK